MNSNQVNAAKESESDKLYNMGYELDFPIAPEVGLLVMIGNRENDLLLLVDADSAILTGNWHEAQDNMKIKTEEEVALHSIIGNYVVQELEMPEEPLLLLQASVGEQQAQQPNILSAEIKQEVKMEFDPLASPAEEVFTYERNTLVDAQFLLASFPQSYSYKKATNIGKFLARIFFDKLPQFETFLPDDKDKPVHLEWLLKLEKQLEPRKNKTRHDLLQLFGGAENDRRNRWSNQRRHFMHFLLTEDECRRTLVLKNNYIKLNQKLHYLYSLKIYEWRLNDSRLVGNFN